MIPLINAPAPYPLDAFHLIVKNAAEEVLHHVQAPDALIGMAFLSTMAVACQGLIDVRLPTGQVRPVSLNLMVIAESGERKTSVDSLVAAPIYGSDEMQAVQYQEALHEYEANVRCWKVIDVENQRQLSEALRTELLVDDLKAQIISHTKAKPVKPRLRRIIRQNATQRAIQEALAGDGESIAFYCDEADIVLKSGAMEHLGLLNKGWDGARLVVFDRAHAESIIARNPRVTVALMVQRSVLRAFCERQGDMARGSGHWARYLVGHPISTQGYRYVSPYDMAWSHLPQFHLRVEELLRCFHGEKNSTKFDRVVLGFSPEARIRWVDLANIIENHLRPMGYLSDMQDFASKMMEIIGRIAAIFHYFSKEGGDITVDTLNRASVIVEWHMDEFKRLFALADSVPQVQIDAHALERYVFAQYWCRNYKFAPKNEVLRSGPIRPRARLDAALDWMCSLGRIQMQVDPKRKRYIQFNPGYFSSLGNV